MDITFILENLKHYPETVQKLYNFLIYPYYNQYNAYFVNINIIYPFTNELLKAKFKEAFD